MSGQERWSTAEYRKAMGISTPSKSKYKNVKTPAADGVVMDSGREATRYKDLLQMQAAGQISELRRQVRFRLDVNGVHVCDYFADFVYRKFARPAGGMEVVEDTKGCVTAEFTMKRKLMLACHGIKVLLT